MKSMKILRFVIIAAMTASCVLAGCNSKTQAKATADNSKLEEAKNAAEAAQKKLYDTRQERMRLEAEKAGKADDSSNKAEDK
jgi:hypothetical protein